MVRTLDVSAAQAHMRRTTGQPFVTAPSELTGKFTRRTRTRWSYCTRCGFTWARRQRS